MKTIAYLIGTGDENKKNPERTMIYIHSYLFYVDRKRFQLEKTILFLSWVICSQHVLYEMD